MFIKWNSIKINGDNNLVLQEADGNVETVAIQEFIARFTAEKDKQISLLSKSLYDKEKIERLSDAEILRLSTALSKAEEERGMLEQQMQLMLKEFDGKDLSQTDPLYQQAFSLFMEGNLDEALKILEETRLVEELQKIEIAEQSFESRRVTLAETYLLKAQMLYLKFNLAETESCFLQAVKIYPSWKTHLDTALHYKSQNQFDEAIKHLNEALLFAHEGREIAGVFSNLGVLYSDLYQFDQAKDFHLKAYNSFKQASQENSNIDNLLSVSVTLNNLGVLENDRGNTSLALEYFLESLEIRQNLVSIAQEILPLYAGSLHNVGTLFYSQADYHTAEKLLNDSLRSFQQLDDSKCLAELVSVHRSLGAAYLALHKYDNSERHFEEALSSCKGLAKNNYPKYAPLLAESQISMADFFVKKYDLAKAELLYCDAIAILRSFKRIYPSVYSPKLALALQSLGILQRDLTQFQESKSNLEEARELFRLSFDPANDAFKSQLAETLNSLGQTQSSLGEVDKAESSIKESLSTLTELSVNNPAKYLPKIAMTHNNLAIFYRQRGRLEAATIEYTKALHIYQELAVAIPDVYLPDFAMVLSNIGGFYFSCGNFAKAEMAYFAALDIRRKPTADTPTVFVPKLIKTLTGLIALYADYPSKKQETILYLKEIIKLGHPIRDSNSSVKECLEITLECVGYLGLDQDNFYREALAEK